LWRDGGVELGRDLLIDNQPGAAHFDGIRTRNYLYAEYANGDRELYDLRKDPYELASQHANPAYAALRSSLATRLHRLVTCAGPTCRAAPAVAMSVRRSGCSIRAGVRGLGALSVGFWIGGRHVATDSKRPFRMTVERRGAVTVRARVAFTGDRLVTADRRVPGC
jgi:hypothetical protein